MRQILFKLLCVMLTLFLLAGCGKAADPAVSGADLPPSEGAAQPAEKAPEESGENPLEKNEQTETVPETEEAEPSAPAQADEQPEEDTMNTIRILVGEAEFTATLWDTEAARALAGMLPLTLDMNELNGNEKYFYLGEALPRASGVPDGIRAGDLMLYGADCLVLFYKDFSTTYSYTPLGQIDDPEGLAEALGSGSARVSFQ